MANMFNTSKTRVFFVALVYGGFLACTSVLLWGGYLAALPPAFEANYRIASYFACGFSFPFGFFVSSAASYATPTRSTWRSPSAAFSLSTAAAILLLTQAYTGTCNTAVGIATGGILGFASALFFCDLQETVANLKIFSSGMAVFGAAAISAALYLILKAIPSNAAVWLVMLVFMPAIAIGQIAIRKSIDQDGKPHPMFQTIPKNNRGKIANAARDLWRPLLCISFSAFLIGIIRADALGNTEILSNINDSGMLGLLVASIALLALWKVIYERGVLSKLQLIVFPLIATSFLLLPFLSRTSQDVFVSFAFTVFSITSSLMVVSCARAARIYAIHPVMTYGAFAGIVYLFLAVGIATSFVFGGIRQDGSLWLFAIALVAIYVLSMALMLGKRPSQLQKKDLAVDKQHPTEERGMKADGAKSTSPVHKERTFDSESRPLEQRCSEAAARFGLTKRETEIMEFLAHGRDVPFIAEELTLSKNTIRTHVKNIFTKMSVHSKQELIDLVSSFEL